MFTRVLSDEGQKKRWGKLLCVPKTLDTTVGLGSPGIVLEDFNPLPSCRRCPELPQGVGNCIAKARIVVVPGDHFGKRIRKKDEAETRDSRDRT